jgi:hypothetical protein
MVDCLEGGVFCSGGGRGGTGGCWRVRLAVGGSGCVVILVSLESSGYGASFGGNLSVIG